MEYLKIVELDNSKDKYPNELSGGEQQRLSLIRSFAYPGELLLLDEPFKSLDIQLKNSLIEYFLKLWNNEKRTVIFVTHEIDEALLLGDNIHVYKGSPITLSNTINIDKEAIRSKLYNKDIEQAKKKVLLEIEKW
jgi:NitT/TauT family transport system ATP-binding protein